ncbi:MAG: S41 family peptidase [bacterium]|nr:S41 family peptidase [bacterium]MCM1374424.1 S41 family peptidase [Muribaculum sp.]
MMEVYEHSNKQIKAGGKEHFFAGLIVGMSMALLIMCVGYLGYQVQQRVEESQQVNADKTSGEGWLSDEAQDKIDTLAYMIEKYYYQDDISRDELENGLYQGLLDAVGDPYTSYYNASDFETFMEQTTGSYYGIGAYVAQDIERNYPKVNSPIPGSPAEEVGLRPNDIIYEVDGVSTYGMDLDKVVSLIKGEEGTTVDITIYRDGKYLDVTVQRRQVEIPTVEQKMLEDDIAYIRIVEFDDVTPGQFKEALSTSHNKGMKGLVLDLRGNPGGSVNAVVDIARMLLPEGLVVYTENKHGKREEYKCDGKNEFELPLVVLVDGNSASASELLSGAIQDYQKGKLVGTTTFGKGIVQQMMTLRDGSAIKITISSYYTPKGRNIHGIGIEPDVECPFDGEAYYNNGYDNQLEKAREVIRDMMK